MLAHSLVARRGFSLLLGAAVAIAAHGSARAQPSPSLADRGAADALARPISPAAVALLLPYAGQPAVVDRLSQALADPRPDVRAVAARVAFTTRQSSLASAVSQALAREQSALAAAELVRASTLLQGAAGDAPIRAVLPRVDSRATAAWLETVNRTASICLPRPARTSRRSRIRRRPTFRGCRSTSS